VCVCERERRERADLDLPKYGTSQIWDNRVHVLGSVRHTLKKEREREKETKTERERERARASATMRESKRESVCTCMRKREKREKGPVYTQTGR